MSFYVDKDSSGEWKITSRVCEKKYKEGKGELPCPYKAKKDFCR